jgi:hypothetical protein
LFAQEGISFGIRFAPTITYGRQFFGDVRDAGQAVSSRLGVNGLLFGHYGFTDNFGVVTGLGLSHRALGSFVEWRDSQLTSLTTPPAKLGLTYLEVPLLLQLTSFDLGGGWYLKGQAGISLDILAGASYRGQQTLKYISRIQPVGASAIGTFGAEWDLFGSGYLDLGLCYHHGLTNVLRQGYEQAYINSTTGQTRANHKPFDGRTLKLGVVGVYVGFIFK